MSGIKFIHSNIRNWSQCFFELRFIVQETFCSCVKRIPQLSFWSSFVEIFSKLGKSFLVTNKKKAKNPRIYSVSLFIYISTLDFCNSSFFLEMYKNFTPCIISRLEIAVTIISKSVWLLRHLKERSFTKLFHLLVNSCKNFFRMKARLRFFFKTLKR